MQLFRVTFLDGRTEDVPGDDVLVEHSGAIVVRREVLVMNRPRTVVARRFSPADAVQSVNPVEAEVEHDAVPCTPVTGTDN